MWRCPQSLIHCNQERISWCVYITIIYIDCFEAVARGLEDVLRSSQTLKITEVKFSYLSQRPNVSPLPSVSFFCLISVLFSFTELAYGMCRTAPSERNDCGYVGITKEDCLGKGCCYDNSYDDGKTPWCFDPPGK